MDDLRAGRAPLIGVDRAELSKFLIWWRDDPDRKFCTLEQAAGAYLQTFPGRTIKLLIELLCSAANVSDPKEPHEPGPPRPKD